MRRKYAHNQWSAAEWERLHPPKDHRTGHGGPLDEADKQEEEESVYNPTIRDHRIDSDAGLIADLEGTEYDLASADEPEPGEH